MGKKSFLRVGYLMMIGQGLLSVLVPKRAISLGTLSWRAGFENVDDLEPREWYVEVTRVLGVGMLAAGLAGLAISREDATDEEFSIEDDSTEDEFSAGDDDDDGPVTVDVDE